MSTTFAKQVILVASDQAIARDGIRAYSNGRRISASSAIGTADGMDRFLKAFKEIFPQKSKTTAAG